MAKNWGNCPWEVDFVPTRRELPATLDFAVAGAGFTGLAAASWLKTLAPEKIVALFESDVIGAGSSGHTGGMALAETAVGDLPGLGDVLAGYQRILSQLQVHADLTLPGVYELGRSEGIEHSRIFWKDSATSRSSKKCPAAPSIPERLSADSAGRPNAQESCCSSMPQSKI